MAPLSQELEPPPNPVRFSWVYNDIVEFEANLLPKLDGLHFVSEFIRNYIHTHHPEAARCKSTLLPNFISDPGSAGGTAYDGDLVSIGTLEPRKNQGYLIRVLHEARQLAIDIR